MAINEPTEKCQRIVPFLGYRDCPQALRFLCEAFGFEERTRMTMPDGRIGYSEIALKDSVIVLHTVWDEAGFASPLDLDGIHTMLLVYVDNVDEHYRRAREAGAIVIGEPEDQPYGHRSYRAIDPEGHRWIFATPITEVRDG